MSYKCAKSAGDCDTFPLSFCLIPNTSYVSDLDPTIFLVSAHNLSKAFLSTSSPSTFFLLILLLLLLQLLFLTLLDRLLLLLRIIQLLVLILYLYLYFAYIKTLVQLNTRVLQYLHQTGSQETHHHNALKPQIWRPLELTKP